MIKHDAQILLSSTIAKIRKSIWVSTYAIAPLQNECHLYSTGKRHSVNSLLSIAKHVAPVDCPDPLPSLTIIPRGEQPGLVCRVHCPHLHAHVVPL